MKQFDIALNKEGKYFNYLCNTFQGISIEKKEMGIFDGPDIRQLVKICISFNQWTMLNQELEHLSNKWLKISLEIEKQTTSDS